jgi:CRISPR/Cas system-associated exonuclease Cas4 (RecB family)
MQIKKTEENKIILDFLMKKSIDSQNERLSTLHVSDLIYPRKAYFNRVNPKPPSEKDLLYWSAGKAHHELLETLYKERLAKEQAVEWENIHGHYDLLAKNGEVIEFKTTRTQTEYTIDNLPEGYLTQLKYYLAMQEKLKGKIIVFYLGIRESNHYVPKLVTYGVSLTREEVKEIRAEMLARKKGLMNALALLNPSLLPECPSWMCQNCKYVDFCIKAKEG